MSLCITLTEVVNFYVPPELSLSLSYYLQIYVVGCLDVNRNAY